jgi:hypothetical protein
VVLGSDDCYPVSIKQFVIRVYSHFIGIHANLKLYTAHTAGRFGNEDRRQGRGRVRNGGEDLGL